MSTQMTERNTTTRGQTIYQERPRLWPWVLAALIIVAALWWSSTANTRAPNDTMTGSLNAPALRDSAPGGPGVGVRAPDGTPLAPRTNYGGRTAP
jgi:hypothetical protein